MPAQETHKPAELIWGHGPKKLEVFLEPTCPFCVRASRKLMPLLAHVGEEAMTLHIYLHSQPWHLFSGVVTRCILAAAALPEGRDKAWQTLRSVGDHREEFEFAHHYEGANMHTTPEELLERLEVYTRLNLAVPFRLASVTEAIKAHTRYARHNKIHVSPSFMLNGTLDERFQSGQSVEEWAAFLK
ncbi:DsbA family protein [Bombella saccharophila]|uniref:Thioredoxin domain-containing protein n=1 Tax=Bombella saccharophila TaxID=2967338 RepID=A0ABT3W8D5_9PROT|nr:thioredoxin domain-containing protein [Bombella saccharophila]MCX5615325.1 thioredoxin domain-containing protein [Bombella saccharophila]